MSAENAEFVMFSPRPQRNFRVFCVLPFPPSRGRVALLRDRICALIPFRTLRNEKNDI